MQCTLLTDDVLYLSINYTFFTLFLLLDKQVPRGRVGCRKLECARLLSAFPPPFWNQFSFVEFCLDGVGVVGSKRIIIWIQKVGEFSYYWLLNLSYNINSYFILCAAKLFSLYNEVCILSCIGRP